MRPTKSEDLEAKLAKITDPKTPELLERHAGYMGGALSRTGNWSTCGRRTTPA